MSRNKKKEIKDELTLQSEPKAQTERLGGGAEPEPSPHPCTERWPWIIDLVDGLLSEFTEASRSVAEEEAIRAFVVLCVRLRTRLHMVYHAIESWLDGRS